MSDKHTHRVTAFFNDAQADFLLERTYEMGMSVPAEYLRMLVIREMRATLRRDAEESEQNQRRLDARKLPRDFADTEATE